MPRASSTRPSPPSRTRGAATGVPRDTHQLLVPPGPSARRRQDPPLNNASPAAPTRNFWMDLRSANTAPAATQAPTGCTRTRATLSNNTLDTAINFILAPEFSLSQASMLNTIRFYRPADRDPTAPADHPGPSRESDSGAGHRGHQFPVMVGGGRVRVGVMLVQRCPLSWPAGLHLQGVGVSTMSATPDGWLSAKDASTNYWGTGGARGITDITWGAADSPRPGHRQPGVHIQREQPRQHAPVHHRQHRARAVHVPADGKQRLPAAVRRRAGAELLV